VESDYFIEVSRHALWILALASAPLLLPALVTGLVLGIVQAATSVSEATLTFVPKLIVIGIILALFGSAIMQLLVDFTHDMFSRIPDLVR
jgi:flagellar biosynthetic protein FliQ